MVLFASSVLGVWRIVRIDKCQCVCDRWGNEYVIDNFQ